MKKMMRRIVAFCLMSIIIATTMVAKDAENVYADAYTPVDANDYTSIVAYEIDRVMEEPLAAEYSRVDIFLATSIASLSDGLSRSYSTVDFSRYEDVTCVMRSDDTHKIAGCVVGYLPDGDMELIYDDNGYDWFGFDRNGKDRNGRDWKGDASTVSPMTDASKEREIPEFDPNIESEEDWYNYWYSDVEGLDEYGFVTRTGLNRYGTDYGYFEDEIKTIKYTTKMTTNGSTIGFVNGNKSYYKVTLTGLKNSKYVEPGVYSHDCEEVSVWYNGFEPMGDNWCISHVPVKNGKAVFYVKAGDFFDTVGHSPISESVATGHETFIGWSHDGAEKNVSVKAEPITKKQLKKATKISAPSRWVLKKADKPNYISVFANEPVKVIGYDFGPGTAYFSLDKKTGRAKIGYLGYREEHNSKYRSGTIKLKGMYSGKVVKVKVVNKSKYGVN